MHPVQQREETIELHATQEEKRLLVEAAARARLDVDSFILRQAVPAARAVMDEIETIQLSARDSLRVLELLEHPPAPTAALMEAARRWRARELGTADEMARGGDLPTP